MDQHEAAHGELVADDLVANERAARRCLWLGQLEQARLYLLALSREYLRRVYAGTFRPDETVAALAAALLARGPAGVQALVPALEACLDLYGDAGRLGLVAQFAAVAQAYPSSDDAPSPALPPAEAAVSQALQAIERRDGAALAAALRALARLRLLRLNGAAAPGDDPGAGVDLPLGALAQLALHLGCPLPDLDLDLDKALLGTVPPALVHTAPAW